MIGVLSKSSERAEVEEFFQLFKTPWEFFRPAGVYDVVLVNTTEIPKLDARLVLSFGAEEQRADIPFNAEKDARLENVQVDFHGTRFPIYGPLQTFKDAGASILTLCEKPGAAAVKRKSSNSICYRFGYDLFREIRQLLTEGQPVQNAHIPTLEMHIEVLRACILKEGLSLVEVVPRPAGADFIVCLTHDIDFVGIRRHFFDHTMFGFLYRSTFGAVLDFMRSRISFGRLVRILAAAGCLPFIYAGWIKDYWMPFDWFLRVEKGLSPTYFLIPFKKRAGEKVSAKHPERRATAYDVTDLPDWTTKLLEQGCEIGVHGIDAWHSAEKGREEIKRTEAVTGKPVAGIRMHWLLQDHNTFKVLEEAGFQYDSTGGYNETVGYRQGTGQVFGPLGFRKILELPLHIQDGALFFPQRLGLSEAEASRRCHEIIRSAEKFGGVLNVLWHDRSHGPERFWGEFYSDLVSELKTRKVWFATGSQAVEWFGARRDIHFEQSGDTLRVKMGRDRDLDGRGFIVRTYRAEGCQERSSHRGTGEWSESLWNGKTIMELETAQKLNKQSSDSIEVACRT